MDEILNADSFDLDYYEVAGVPSDRNLIGFVLFDQNFSRDPISDFLSNIDMLNTYSGKYVHFFLCGVSFYGSNQYDTSKEIGRIGGKFIYHNSGAAMSFVTAFQDNISSWEYDFGVELILIDVVSVDGRRRLDFDSAIYFKVEELIKLKIIDRTSQLLGKLIRLVQTSEVRTSRDFLGHLKGQFGINWFKGLVLALFPKAVGKLARGQAVLGGGAALAE
jgi:hypothetical protein